MMIGIKSHKPQQTERQSLKLAILLAAAVAFLAQYFFV